MTRRRAIACAVALIGLLVVASVVHVRRPDAPAPAEVRRPAPAVEAVAGASLARTDADARALARAVAAVGAAEDGAAARLERLDPAARGRLDEARALLALHPPAVRGAGRPTVAADGSVMRIGGPTPSGAPSDAPLPATSLPATSLPATPAAQEPRPVAGEGPAKDLVEPGAWIAIPFDPMAAGERRLRLRNRSAGGYALRLSAEDFGSVRLDGALVVPDRFYVLDDETVVESELPVDVIIRPLEAVPAWHPTGVRPPLAAG